MILDFDGFDVNIMNNPKKVMGVNFAYAALFDRYILRPAINKLGGWDDKYKGIIGTGVELASKAKQTLRPFSDFKYR